MKRAAALCLLFAATAIARAEETPAATEQCEAPRIPSISTSQAGASRVQKQLKAWDECIAKNKTDPALIAKVQAEADAWFKATTGSQKPWSAAARGEKDRMRNTPTTAGEDRPSLQ